MRVAFFIYSVEIYRMYPFFLFIRTQVNKYPCIHKLSTWKKSSVDLNAAKKPYVLTLIKKIVGKVDISVAELIQK